MLSVVLFEHAKPPFQTISVFWDGIVFEIMKEVGKGIENKSFSSSKRFMGVPPFPGFFSTKGGSAYGRKVQRFRIHSRFPNRLNRWEIGTFPPSLSLCTSGECVRIMNSP
jgi:hypothetical protein